MIKRKETFKGKLNNKSLTDFKKLDYTVEKNINKRLEKINELLGKNDTNEYDNFFIEYFDEKFKSELNSDDFLSSDNDVCNLLESYATYLLQTDEAKEIDCNTIEIDKLDKKIIQEQIGNFEKNKTILNNIIESTNNKNYKLDTKIKLSKLDCNDSEMGNYMQEYYKMIAMIDKCVLEGKLSKFKADSMKKEIKEDMLILKEKIKRPIYFKQPLKDSTATEWDMLDWNNKDHVKSLLKIPKSIDFTRDLTCMVYDIDNLIKKCNFDNVEKEILYMWRSNDNTQEKIAESLGTTQQNVDRILNKIVSKIIKEYKEIYEDWYFLNIEKGEYKVCKKCGEIKLVSKFGNKKDSKDGLSNICKKCDSLRKNK